jgi:hypothetical protein
MNALAFIHRKTRAGAKPGVARRRAIEQAQLMGIVAGLVGGASSGVFGAVFTAAGWLVANEGARRWLSTTGAILLFLTIPLLIIGGLCMDWIEKTNPQRDPKVAPYKDDDWEK